MRCEASAILLLSKMKRELYGENKRQMGTDQYILLYENRPLKLICKEILEVYHYNQVYYKNCFLIEYIFLLNLLKSISIYSDCY